MAHNPDAWPLWRQCGVTTPPAFRLTYIYYPYLDSDQGLAGQPALQTWWLLNYSAKFVTKWHSTDRPSKYDEELTAHV